ncbi:MAG: HNH endonuclease domain-containing protein, partial [Balneolaceae bacterium]
FGVMEYEVLKNINQIIERDSKDTTYKFALLRATIEVIQQKSPHSIIKNDRVSMPVGLLVLKWLEYYYPIVEARLPQKNGDDLDSNTLTFRSQFEEITDHYKSIGGYDVFYKDFLKCRYPDEMNDLIYSLCKKIRDTITKQPMRYIGSSISDNFYSIYKKEEGGPRLSKPQKLDVEFMIERFGRYTIPLDYFTVFEYLGSFITGTHSILINWAEFTKEKSNRSLSLQKILPIILQSPLDERDTKISSDIFDNYLSEHGNLFCVWSGKTIRGNRNIDHLLPFSVWRNNDLWNLLPSTAKMNSDKKDRIPGTLLLESSKDRIISYWKYIHKSEPEIFRKELKISLIADNSSNWENAAFNSLKEKSRYLIETRGFEEFNL